MLNCKILSAAKEYKFKLPINSDLSFQQTHSEATPRAKQIRETSFHF